MLNQKEWEQLSKIASDKKMTKKGLLKYIEDNLVVETSSNTRDPSGYTVPINTGIKSPGADKGVSVMTAKESQKNDRIR